MRDPDALIARAGILGDPDYDQHFVVATAFRSPRVELGVRPTGRIAGEFFDPFLDLVVHTPPHILREVEF